MGHLRHPVEQLDPPRHHAPRARGQETLQVVAARVEEHQFEPGGRVVDLHPVGPAPRGRAVAADRDLHRRGAGDRDVADRGFERAVDAPLRQGQKQVLGRFDRQPREVLRRFRSDPVQRLQPREKREQDLAGPRPRSAIADPREPGVLVDRLDPQFGGLLRLRPRAGARHDKVRLGRDAARDASRPAPRPAPWPRPASCVPATR
jgi:hypothetical protein